MSKNDFFADVFSDDQLIPARYASGGYSCISLKATEGDHYVNPKYHEWVVECHRHDLPVLHYHFARPENNDPIGEAEHFWNTVKDHTRRPGDFLFWDLETGSPSQGAQWLLKADAHLRAISGYEPGVYTFLSYFFSGRVTIHSKRIWIAAWGNSRPGSVLWNLPFGQELFAWQYTDGRGFGPGPQRFAGIVGANSGGTCDGSLLNPSIARQLRKQRNPR